LKNQNVLGPQVVNGLDVAGYWWSGLKKSWTVPSLHVTSKPVLPLCCYGKAQDFMMKKIDS